MNKDRYKKNEVCISFTNEEIREYLLNELKAIENLDIILLSEKGMIIDSCSHERISSIVFDGINEEFFINLYNDHAVLCFEDQVIMFIDDELKDEFGIDMTYLNVIYEGTLRDKTHKEILRLFVDIVSIISNYKKIEVEFIPIVEKNRKRYPYHENIITIYGKENSGETFVLENLTFKLV